MNSTELFSLALGLESPWEIKSVEMKVSKNSIKELHLHIGYTRGFQFKEKRWISLSCSRYVSQGMETHEFFEHQCYPLLYRPKNQN